MSTTMLNKDTVVRKWYVLDAAGKPLGKTAALAADLLRGKLKVDYTPHVDCGDFVIVTNVEKLVFTGNKLDKKKYYRHTGHPGGLKEVSYRDLMANKPEFAFQKAVKGMLPKNSMGRAMLKKLKVYAGPEHKHEAQQPEKLEII